MENLTDEKQVKIAKTEYDDLKVNKEVKINGITIGYGSEVINKEKQVKKSKL